ncbi:glycosyltransferase [Fictibacillus sp. S7]|uniref:glycosyltransferase n=1 Tax=Fictibacillus sp. S7 TaxID=2212476 RepID=UPI0010130721|nr:glycosyltransferase [Fictibacillus sp. S7]RXZ01499.1 glycosyl transferase family 1 [Fictibacillus sp. S7]
MNILHVSLGLPPYRTGGLTKYSLDLMLEQKAQQHSVSLLFPGHYTISNKCNIVKRRDFNGIQVYELNNPLPVPLTSGVQNPSYFYQKSEVAIFKKYLKDLSPDIIHFHTLMGIYKEFIQAAKDIGIRTVFTTHDYFGICPKVNLIDTSGAVCDDYLQGEKCIGCNINGFSLPMIHLLQSHTYKKFKESNTVKKIRKYKKGNIKTSELEVIVKKPKIMTSKLANEYVVLRSYYIEMLNLIDLFHFNSSVAKKQYERYLNVNGRFIPITHSDIIDKRKNNDHALNFEPTNPLKITYLGPINKYKGFYLLKDSLNDLMEKGQKNWHLNVYGDFLNDPVAYNPKHYTFNGRYQYSDLQKIFSATDLLVIPSIWKETFGFIGLEALSHGVPTLVSEYVGFKDIIEDKKTGIVFRIDKNILANKISVLINNRNFLQNIKTNIMNMHFPYTMKEHTKEIINLYNQVEVGVGS